METTNKLKLICILIIMGLLDSSCIAVKYPETQPSKTATLLPFTPQPFIPSITQTATASLSPTILPGLELTSTSMPTLTKLQKSDLVTSLIEMQKNCALPCWWGINPGDSTVVNAQRTLEKLGFVNPEETGIGSDLQGEFLQIGFTLGLDLDNGKINHIYVFSASNYNRTGFRKLWLDYSPEKIIASYGQPTRIKLSLYESTKGDNHKFYRVIIFYDDLGILLHYDGWTDPEDVNQICPTFNTKGNLYGYIEMWLKSPNDKIPLDQLADSYRFGPESFIHPLEEVTGMSIADFYQKILKQKENFCFKIPADKWP
jgi:hypothetical protein